MKDGLHILAYGACLLQAHQHVGPQLGRALHSAWNSSSKWI